MKGSGAAGEPGDAQVERAPEQVHRTVLADETRPEVGEHSVHLHEREPEVMHLRCVVGRVSFVGVERDRAGDLDGHRPDRGVQAELVQLCHELGVEVRHRPRLERHGALGAVRRRDAELVIDEVERHLEPAVSPRDQRSRETAVGDVQRHVPPVVDERRVHHPHLADDLRPELQRVPGVLPIGDGDGWPRVRCVGLHHDVLRSTRDLTGRDQQGYGRELHAGTGRRE